MRVDTPHVYAFHSILSDSHITREYLQIFSCLIKRKDNYSSSNKVVERYLSPVSGKITTIVFPANSGRIALTLAA